VTVRFADAGTLVDAIIGRVGPNVVLGLPVGIGKALHVANALYRHALANKGVQLTIFTGLTLTRPSAGSPLEARLLDPFAERLYGSWPTIDYAAAMQSGKLPDNIQVREFYLRPGAYLGNGLAQQSYTSINYSEVADELLALGVNVIAQLVAADPARPGYYSLGSNPEVTLDLLPRMRERQQRVPCLFVGQVSSAMPYMPRDAELPATEFDCILDNETLDQPLFSVPNRRVSAADYAIGMHVASLVPDGGTLQVGIGSLSDAVAHCLRLRHEQPALFERVLERLPGGSRSPRRRSLPVETGPFVKGLYACSELLSDALFMLFSKGIVRRPASDEDETQIHAGFFLGSGALYEGLRQLSPEHRQRIGMTRISFVNTLYGEEMQKRTQRRHARFVNETMMATLLGAAVSDALGDGRVVSGVGGQFDFVTMATDLEDAHSILVLRAFRQNDGGRESNIRSSYPHNTVPRQQRDVFVSEYGIASTRGRPDAEVIDAMLHIADAGFQQALLEAARRAGKVSAAYRLDAAAGDNVPRAITAVFAAEDIAPAFPPYPLGTELTAEEQALVEALSWLKAGTSNLPGRLATILKACLRPVSARHHDALTRMRLARAASPREWLDRRLVALALEETYP
jgi:acyl-CoA hydrolase